MAAPIGYVTPLDEPDFVEAWIHYFVDQDRVKKLKDRKVAGRNIIDLYLVSVEREAIRKISAMAYPREL